MPTLLCLLLLLLSPALHLEADASRQELVRGDTFTIDAYLFNDGAAQTQATFDIVGPAGFELVDVTTEEGAPAPGQAAHARFRYRVLEVAPKGRATFVVSGGGQIATAVVRVGPPPQKMMWLAMVRG